MSFEFVDIIECPTCHGGKRCTECKGAGVLHVNAEQTVTCYACKGNGVCVTCKGTAEYTRTRTKLDALIAPQPGHRLCPSCDGKRHCPACLGTGRRENGTFCKVCDMHSGLCIECNGTGEVPVEASEFELVGSEGDEVRLLRCARAGYSIALAGRPRIVPSPTAGPKYDVVVRLDDVAVEHGFRIDDVPTKIEVRALATALANAYRGLRSSDEAAIRPLPNAFPTRGSIGGVQTIYTLKDATEPTMEQLWVVIHEGPAGLQALYHTTRFRNSDVNTMEWGHVRASFIDQHLWRENEQRAGVPAIWPDSAITLPSAKLSLTEAANASANAKALEVGAISAEEQHALMVLFREIAQADFPPRMPVSDDARDTIRQRLLAACSAQASSVFLRGLADCATRHDVRGWAWQNTLAIGNRPGGAH